jgi:hypothetical protein
VNAVGSFGVILTVFVVNKIGRKPLMGILFILSGLFTLMTGFWENVYWVVMLSSIVNFLSNPPWVMIND